MNTQPTIKECPCCAGECAVNTVRYPQADVTLNGWQQDTFYGVNCIRCGLNNRGIIGHSTPEAAIAAWEQRTDVITSHTADAVANFVKTVERRITFETAYLAYFLFSVSYFAITAFGDTTFSDRALTSFGLIVSMYGVMDSWHKWSGLKDTRKLLSGPYFTNAKTA